MKNALSINASRSEAGIPRVAPVWVNVFMRTLPGTMIKGFAFTAPAAAITKFTFVIPQRRGDVQAILPVFNTVTIGDVARDTFTLFGNGVEIFSDDVVSYYTPVFDSYLDKRQYARIPENSTFTFTVDRTNGLNDLHGVVQTYYSPISIMPPQSVTQNR